MTHKRPEFAEQMVDRVGAPGHLEGLLRAGEMAAGGKGYSVDIITGCACSRIEHDFDPHTGAARGGRIFICADAGGDAAWDFLHELGHALQGRMPGLERTCAHETRMWESGWHWAIAQNCDSLTASDRAAFIKRARECLNSYCTTPPRLSI